MISSITIAPTMKNTLCWMILCVCVCVCVCTFTGIQVINTFLTVFQTPSFTLSHNTKYTAVNDINHILVLTQYANTHISCLYVQWLPVHTTCFNCNHPLHIHMHTQQEFSLCSEHS